jgi:hypothetical protein
MTELDQALAVLRNDMNDPEGQSKYYDLFLNSVFCVPTVSSEVHGLPLDDVAEGTVMPLVIEAEGGDYLMLFDTRERLVHWAQAEVDYVEVPGHVLAANTMPPLQWALNVGSEHSKRFISEEIEWLKDVVAQCEAAGDGNDPAGSEG